MATAEERVKNSVKDVVKMVAFTMNWRAWIGRIGRIVDGGCHML